MQNSDQNAMTARAPRHTAPHRPWGSSMKKHIISLAFLLAASAAHGAAPDLQPTAPDRYTVAEGDTLWSIAGRYLKSPWRWNELWSLNNQVQNPHRIYPGDVLVLERTAPDIEPGPVAVTLKLEPRIRIERQDGGAVPVIPARTIEPFLSRPLVVGERELDAAPRIVATQEGRVALGAGNVAYVDGIAAGQGERWQIVRRGAPLVDPETREILGYEAVFLGEARVREQATVSTLEITRSTQEIYQHDRLLPLPRAAANFGYEPQAPASAVTARVISQYGGVQEGGPLSIIGISKGARDGLAVGHVLALHRDPTTSRRLRNEPIFGRTGPAGSDAPRTYYSEELTPRDAPLVTRGVPVTGAELAKLPRERYGLAMVFRVFDRAAYALILEAQRPVTLADVLTNP